ncbi:MAG: hypothetical protein H6828_13070 [Planctomycetes bacterium]|nr:hypothetical protein [Planctomycetota bacterium]
MSAAPVPLLPGELDAFLAAMRGGATFKAAVEALLLALPEDRAARLMLLMREGRAAWHPLLRAGGGRALLVGNAFSGTAHALAAAGFELVLHDASRERLEFEAARCRDLVGVEPELVPGAAGARLPFEDGAFDLVLQEDGPPSARRGVAHDLGELWRVTRGELVLVADNRLGYKRSLGARGEFAVPSPVQYVVDVARGARGEHALAGHRKALARVGAAPERALALYPHSLDFTHVVGLGGDGPNLHIGPMERRNQLKMAAYGAGLFPLLTPSFALVSARPAVAATPPRVERALAALAERLGEPRPVVDELVATRGNTAVVFTRVPDAPDDAPAGRWCLHVPLSPQQEAQIARHHAVLERLWSPTATLPVPQPLFRGVVEGLSLSVERRLGGLTAPQLSGDVAKVERTLADLVEHLAGLVVAPPRVLDEAAYERDFGARFDLVARFCGRAETERALRRMRDETRERVLGLAVPRVLAHMDLRSKHVQVDAAGRVLGLLDWGSSVDADVPYHDLLQFLVHEYKQARVPDMRRAWALLLDPHGPRPRERELLDAYCRRLGLAPEYQQAMERCFPVFVAAMAEANWDYSRPRWVHAQFGL